jgi:hypothetical protein
VHACHVTESRGIKTTDSGASFSCSKGSLHVACYRKRKKNKFSKLSNEGFFVRNESVAFSIVDYFRTVPALLLFSFIALCYMLFVIVVYMLLLIFNGKPIDTVN